MVTYAQTESSFVPTGDSPIIYSVNYFQIKQKHLLSAEGVSKMGIILSLTCYCICHVQDGTARLWMNLSHYRDAGWDIRA